MFTELERILIENFACAEAWRINHTTAVSPAHNETQTNRLAVCNSILAKLDEGNEPITPEWLEEMGAETITGPSSGYMFPFGGVSLTFDCDGVGLQVNIEELLPHIKTRHQFKRLFFDLSGKELGE